MDIDLVSYYDERANEYEKIYNKPERQNDLIIAERILLDSFANKDVIEIACGTGYWTQKIAVSAKNILAIDINETVLEVAKSKTYSPATVIFQTNDFYSLVGTNKHESLFGGFIWSHIKLEELNSFVEKAFSLVKSGGTIVFIDNNFIEGISSPIAETDDFGNTYQIRKLENGNTYKVLKNFPEQEFIRQLLINKVSNMKFIMLNYYWILICEK